MTIILTEQKECKKPKQDIYVPKKVNVHGVVCELSSVYKLINSCCFVIKCAVCLNTIYLFTCSNV